MLNKKKILFKWLLLSLTIVSCNNNKVTEKLETFEIKIPNKQDENKSSNISIFYHERN